MKSWTQTPYRSILMKMTANVITTEQFRDNLRTKIPSIYHADYDLLMQQYDYG